MVVLAKIRFLSCGLSNWQLLALLLPFAMKLPFAFNIPVSLAEVIISIRCFLFRLNRILFGNTLARGDQRWERAFRLVQERTIINSSSEMMWSDDDALNLSIMML